MAKKIMRDSGVRTLEKSFKLKSGEELIDIRISLGSAPVGGRGPRPKKEILLTATVARQVEKSPKPKAAKLKKKRPQAEPDKPKTPVGGMGTKRRVNP